MQLIERAMAEADVSRGEAGDFEARINAQLRTYGLTDGIPTHVSNACWTAALRLHKAPRRGPNTLALKEYQKRVAAWLNNRAEITAKAAREHAERAAVNRAAAAARVVSPVQAELQNRVLQDNFETVLAEAAADWAEIDKETIGQASHPDNLVKNVTIKEAGKIEFSTPHGHAVLAASRSWLDRSVRLKGVKCMLELQRPGSRAVVIDVGAGASGVKNALKVIDEVQGASSIYHHCCFPIACASDLARDNTLARIMNRINWISPGVQPILGAVNVCSHHAFECDCALLYHDRFFMSVHSQYYYARKDWDNLFKYTNEVHVVTHLPESLGRPVPTETPEATWLSVSAAKTTSWDDRLRSNVNQRLYGREDLAFEPLQDHGTTYVQVDPRVDVQNGGFHMRSGIVDKVRDLVDSNLTLGVAAAAGLALLPVLTAAVGIKGMMSSTSGNFSITRQLFNIAASVLPAVPAICCQMSERARTATTPQRGTHYTVKIVNGYTLNHKGENLAHFYKYIKTPPSMLEQRVVASNPVNPDVVRELTAMMASSKKDSSGCRQVAVTRCMRQGLSETETEATINAALEKLDRLCPKNASGLVPSKEPDPVTRESAFALVVLRRTAILAAAALFCITLRQSSGYLRKPPLVDFATAKAHCGLMNLKTLFQVTSKQFTSSFAGLAMLERAGRSSLGLLAPTPPS